MKKSDFFQTLFRKGKILSARSKNKATGGKNIFTKRQKYFLNGQEQKSDGRKFFHKKAEIVSEQVINVAAQDKNKDIKAKNKNRLRL